MIGTNFLRRGILCAMLLASFMAGSLITSTADASQWRMLDARRALNNALNFLNAAEEDKAGYRVKAIADVNQAISDVNAGIQAGKK